MFSAHAKQEQDSTTYPIRYVKHVRNPHTADAISFVGCDSNSVALLIERDGRGVVYFDDGVVCVGVNIG